MSQDQKNTEDFVHTLQHMHLILQSSEKTTGLFVSLSNDLGKLLCDKTQKNKQLIHRVLPNFKLHPTETIPETPIIKGISLTPNFLMPFQVFNGIATLPPIAQKPPIDLNEWLDQLIIQIDHNKLSIKEVITFIRNTEGSHSDSDMFNSKAKSKSISLVLNTNLRHALIFGIAHFIYASICMDQDARKILPSLPPVNIGKSQ